ncbi:phosphoribosylglycinamide formyltransferase [Barrientosiimonas humi]|uniref:phosphoribosylglycinamide formyltransferase n=1 Tax=Barrientosiimonas humi TaxID=999931 RepID=UPI00370D7A4E
MTSAQQPPGVPIVVLVSGSGTLLQSLLDACADPAYGVRVVAVGADRPDIEGLARAERAGVATFVTRLRDFPDRAAWDAALAESLTAYAPRFVVTAGFMKILGPRALAVAPAVNTHPALLPSFPGAHGVRDALAHGVTVTGATMHLVDDGLDSGPILDQRVVHIQPDDDEAALHERIKVVERAMLVEQVGAMAREGFRVEGRRVRIGS